MIIKDKSLVHLEKDEIDYKEYIIKKYFKSYNKSKLTKLSKVFKFLPNGLVHKEETGMGATTLELKAKRNSIIVEPIKITASSKAFHHSKPPDNTVLYVGSETRYHAKKSNNYSIQRYINNAKIKYKKIIVVADSLHRIIDIIGEEAYSKYFLLIDEADSFQMDSTFRKSMEECLDIYKKFQPDKRCLLSSTLLDFSDPELASEPKTVIKYDQPSPRNIKIVVLNGSTIAGACIEQIEKHLNNTPQDKILIAYNSVSGCYDLAEYLKKHEIIAKKDISILCSINSKSKVEDYYKELDSDILPTKINFITSAYFTGFDLNESFSLISISENKRSFQSLSDKRLKQIAGRCRKELKSETIIYDLAAKGSEMAILTKEELIAIADIELDALRCMQKHFSKNKILSEVYGHISEIVMSTLDSKNTRYIKKNKSTNEFEISYLNIDAALETNRACFELYTQYNALPDKLKADGHHISFIIAQNALSVEKQDVEKIDRVKKIEKIISILRGVQDEFDLEELSNVKGFNALQKKILKHFNDLYGFIEPNHLLDEFTKVSQKRDSRELNRLILAANFVILPDDNSYKIMVNKYFKLNVNYTSLEILSRWNMIFVEANLNKQIDSKTKAVRHLKLHFNCKRQNNGSYKTLSNNPFRFIVTKTKESVTDFIEIENDISSLSEYLN